MTSESDPYSIWVIGHVRRGPSTLAGSSPLLNERHLVFFLGTEVLFFKYSLHSTYCDELADHPRSGSGMTANQSLDLQ